MPRRDAITLSDLSYRFARIEIACARCGRRGSYDIGRAISGRGDLSLPDFLAAVSADCPNREGLGVDRCAAMFPQLASAAL